MPQSWPSKTCLTWERSEPLPYAKMLSQLQHTKNKDGDTPIFTKDVLGSDAASFAVDRALSQLAAVMSKTLRQLVTPMAAQVDLEAADALTNGWEHDDGDRAAAAAQQTSATL
jgi:hypothetical protein